MNAIRIFYMHRFNFLYYQFDDYDTFLKFLTVISPLNAVPYFYDLFVHFLKQFLKINYFNQNICIMG